MYASSQGHRQARTPINLDLRPFGPIESNYEQWPVGPITKTAYSNDGCPLRTNWKNGKLTVNDETVAMQLVKKMYTSVKNISYLLWIVNWKSLEDASKYLIVGSIVLPAEPTESFYCTEARIIIFFHFSCAGYRSCVLIKYKNILTRL